MEHGPTSWEDDEVSDEALVRMWRVQPTEEYREEVEALRGTETVKLGDLLNDIADYAMKFANEDTIYVSNSGGDRDNPLQGNPPYEMSNPSFVHWCYEANRAPLIGRTDKHTVREIMNSPRLDTVYNVGSNVNLEGLLRGDLLFFNNGRHVGIFVGGNKFVSMDGPLRTNTTGRVRVNSLEDGYWKSIFKGHVKRLVR